MGPTAKELLSLYAIPGIGANKIRALVGKFKTVERILNARLKELVTVEGIDLKLAQRIRQRSDDDFVEIQMTLLEKANARIITFWDDDYPENLKKIYDPPTFLFARGEYKKEDKWAVAIVGSRLPSTYGKLVTEKFSKGLAKRGIIVVSGLARGIDTLAHLGSLQAGGRTIAVLGSGIDVIYPPENKKLVEKIEENGLILSEFPMGTKPDAVNFPRRNRIISGLSLGVLVVEAGVKSGALITANLALEQNREIFVVPGNINNPKSEGCNRLIRDGAKLVISDEDVIDELKPQLAHLLNESRAKPQPSNLSSLEAQMLNSLNTEQLHIDQIAINNRISTSQALGVLLSLELKDLVRQLPGKFFVKI
ncbi:hypothetical protein AMJ86_00600 [bacterium SM23_57]|nr:MAG: hypothetical protein AMJ86_00600 [bacterium SM23_57]